MWKSSKAVIASRMGALASRVMTSVYMRSSALASVVIIIALLLFRCGTDCDFLPEKKRGQPRGLSEKRRFSMTPARGAVPFREYARRETQIQHSPEALLRD